MPEVVYVRRECCAKVTHRLREVWRFVEPAGEGEPRQVRGETYCGLRYYVFIVDEGPTFAHYCRVCKRVAPEEHNA